MYNKFEGTLKTSSKIPWSLHHIREGGPEITWCGTKTSAVKPVLKGSCDEKPPSGFKATWSEHFLVV